MDRNKREKILIAIAAKLRNKYAKEPSIWIDEGKVIVENASEPNAPIIPEELAAIRDEVIKEFELNPSDLVSSVFDNGSVMIGFSSN